MEINWRTRRESNHQPNVFSITYRSADDSYDLKKQWRSDKQSADRERRPNQRNVLPRTGISAHEQIRSAQLRLLSFLSSNRSEQVELPLCLTSNLDIAVIETLITSSRRCVLLITEIGET